MKAERFGLLCALVALLGCAKFKSLLGKDTPDAATSAAPVATAPSGERGPSDGVCNAGERKVWGKWANRRTGLTPARLGGKLAVGVALGNTPHVIVFDDEGGGRLVKVSAPNGSPLARDIRAPDARDLHRVTPAKRDGAITAYADYRDKYRDGRRRIACGHVESLRAMVAFEGEPLLDRDDDKPDAGVAKTEPTAPSRAVGVIPRLKLPKKGAVGAVANPPAARAAQPPSAAADAAAPPATPPAAPEKKRAVSEVRDCRTFVDDDGSVWAAASELRGDPQDDGTHKWSMRFYAAPDAGRGYVTLHTVALPKVPKKLYTFETPVAGQVAGGHVLFARHQGTLFGWGLGAGFRPSGGMRAYRGGYPTMPHLIADGDALWALTSVKTSGDSYELRGTELRKFSLPASLDKLEIAGSEPSLAEPTLAKAGEQRWLSYQAGSRREGRLVIVPVDGALKAVGQPFDVTESGITVYESHIFGLGDGKLLALYIQNGEPGAELVSQVLSCTVKS